ncbi:MAG: EAL domain-containing protein [Rhizobiaceae bacterium]|nr:EAL domain-containing protein [Rhizobiaceae bacterium]
MTPEIKAGAPDQLVLNIRAAYWGAVLLIAAMALVSFLLVQDRLKGHQHDDALLAIISQQKALSQRIVFLANAAESVPADERPPFVHALEDAVGHFEKTHDLLLSRISGQADDADTHGLEAIFYGAPNHLDYFVGALAANGHRLISTLRDEGFTHGEASPYSFSQQRARFDETVATAALGGFTALERSISEASLAELGVLRDTHRYLFYAVIGVIVMVVILIFMPMTGMVSRRTNELVDARNTMAYVAVHDGLTGLYNRAFLRDQFDRLIKSAERRDEHIAILQLDLDRFKQINDTLGHAAGDLVLVKTAERMKGVCRASDLCVRLGGDEFVIVLSAAGDTEDINTVANRILRSINEPIDFEGATIHPGASAGIAVYPLDADNADDLLVHADLALYAAKKSGGGSCSFFSEELRAELDHRKRLERDLAGAIARREFSVHFQPQISLTTGGITGVEALVRWQHAERGPIPPGEFIPVAEKAGLMVDIGRIVFEKAIGEAAAWHRSGFEFGRLAINVSGTELREADFYDFLFGTLEEAGLPPEKLSLEIVESVILDDEKTGIAPKLRAIRAAGVHLELDDFGTGYASLSHVNPNEIDRLKIDRRFVQSIDLNMDNTMIVRAITELARGLGISLIAEGAETTAELDALMALGCDQVQGYSVAFPMPDQKARQWIEQRNGGQAAATAGLKAG